MDKWWDTIEMMGFGCALVPFSNLVASFVS